MKEANRSHLITDINPMGTDGFEFVEYASANPDDLHKLFRSFGFIPSRKHKSKDITLYTQGDIKFLVNGEPGSFGRTFYEKHGPCACSFGIRVADAGNAYDRALALGAAAGESELTFKKHPVPCIRGIGQSYLYLVDHYGEDGSIFDEFEPVNTEDSHQDAQVGLEILDHLTHNVDKGDMDKWAGFYERLFNFREIRFFDIEGKLTGLKSRAMTSPCGKIKIPINESSDDKSQIAEYIKQYNGEGIQHIALTSSDIFTTVDRMRELGTEFMPCPPDTYYEMLSERLPWHTEDESALKQRGILLDGGQTNASGDGLLLQIFTMTVIGPIFFEIIQRKGDDGFGEGNFKALFESIERDQIRRGVLKDE